MTAIPTPEEFVARAKALAVKFRERAQEAEDVRRMPDQSVKDFLDAEFYRIMQPKKYGGCEYGWDVWCQCLIELARGSASQAWATMVHVEYVQMLQGFSQQVQDEIWGDNPAALISSSFQPVGKLEVVEGGYTLQTVGPRWGFSSGCDEASWFFIGAIIPGKGWSFLVVPRSDITIHDDWHVMGLKGSGSKSLTIDKPIFIPEYRVASDMELTNGGGPGVNDNSTVISHYPRKAGAGFGYISVPLGAAIEMLDTFKAMMKDKVAGREKTSADQAIALRIAETASEIDAVKRAMFSLLDEHWKVLSAGGTLTTQQRLDTRREIGYMALNLQRASQRMLSAAGTRAIYKSSPLQRCFRDINAGCNHMGVSWEMAATPYGESVIGQQPAMGSF